MQSTIQSKFKGESIQEDITDILTSPNRHYHTTLGIYRETLALIGINTASSFISMGPLCWCRGGLSHQHRNLKVKENHQRKKKDISVQNGFSRVRTTNKSVHERVQMTTEDRSLGDKKT